MDKILIVGHPQSGHHDIEQILVAAGMAQARPSRREGLLPGPLGALLCSAHNVSIADDSSTDDAVLHQIPVSPVWNGLALDLMLANVDQPVWGWSDPAAVRLLQFWHDIDPDIHFVMVYDTPGALLAGACQTGVLPSEWPEMEPVLCRRMHQWMHYHEALLQFYLRHTKRCLLVQRQQARHAPGGLLARLQDRMTASWTGQPHPVEPTTAGTELLTRWVAEAVADHFPAARQLYEELQLTASLPRPASHGTDLHGIGHVWSTLMADLRRGHHQRQEIRAHCAQIDQLQTQLQTVEQRAAAAHAASLQQLAFLSEAVQAADVDQQRLLRQLRQMAHIARARQHRVQRLGQQASERQHMLEQSQVCVARQTRLLDLHRQKRQQEHGGWLAQLQQAEQRAQGQQRALEQAQAHAAEQACDAATLTQRLHTLGQDRERLLSQLQQVQEALAQQHARQQAQQHAQQQRSQRLEQQVRSQTCTIEQGEGRAAALQTRLQEQAAEQARDAATLTQRLNTLEQDRERLLSQLQQVQEALAQQHARQHEQQQARQHAQQQLSQSLEQLPRLEQLARERALRIEQLEQLVHSQTRTIEQCEEHTAALQTRAQEQAAAHQSLTEDHTRLVAQLHHVQQRLAQQHHAPVPTPVPVPAPVPTEASPPAALFGAADRVKAQLSYRLGATLIQHSRSLGGWLRMPFALVATVTQFEREKPQRQAHRLPPIHQYRDAHEAERIRGHLSYRLGAVMVRHATTPWGWGRMPFAMQREIRAFRMGQRV